MNLVRASLCLAMGAAALVATAAPAADFQVISGTRGATVAFVDPIGQSFTAIDSMLNSIGFQFQGLNTGDANTPLTFTLYAGEGFGGTVLAARSVTLPASAVSSRTPTWFDIDLGSVATTIGQKYTGAFTATTNRAALTFGPDFNIYTGVPLSGDAYAGGKLVSTGDPDAYNYCTNSGNCDLNFRISGTTLAAVPEPATWAMMIAGFGAVGGSMRRKRIATVAATA